MDDLCDLPRDDGPPGICGGARADACAPGSVQLSIDTDGDTQALFEVMLLIMTEMLKKWYPPPISIPQVSTADLGRLVAYFASFGMRFHLDVEENPRVVRINNRDYMQKSRLEDMKFKILSDNKLYSVHFSHA